MAFAWKFHSSLPLIKPFAAEREYIAPYDPTPEALSGEGPDFQQMLKDPQYKTAEETIVLEWPRIQTAAAREGMSPALLGAEVLQQMRAMNWDDLNFDDTWLTGPSQFHIGTTIGISQTPVYILQKIAKEVGLPSLSIAKGRGLTNREAADLLHDPSASIDIAAAHSRMVTDYARKYFVSQKLSPAVAGRFFDLNRVKNTGDITDEENDVASVIGFNVDQWNIETRVDPEIKSPGRNSWEKAIVIALGDIRRNLNAAGVLTDGITKTPRTYIEDAYTGKVGPITLRLSCLAGFKKGDVTANFFPRDGNVRPELRQR